MRNSSAPYVALLNVLDALLNVRGVSTSVGIQTTDLCRVEAKVTHICNGKCASSESWHEQWVKVPPG